MSELRERILNKALLLNRVEYYVDEWDETVYFQELSGKQLADFTKTTYKEVDGIQQADPIVAMVNILYYTLVDEDGMRLLTKKELNGMNGLVLMKLGNKALEMSGLTNAHAMLEAKDELKKTDENVSSSS